MPAKAVVLQWLSLVGIIWLQSINGTNFNFPAYSTQLKNQLSISQLQLNNLAFASDAGKLFGWFSGIATCYLPLWLVLLIGSTLGLVGYGVQYLFITYHMPTLSYWHIFFFTVVAGNSICWINTVCYIVVIKNFPTSRQVAVGISTSFQGLSAKIYTDAVDAVFSSSPDTRARAFLLLNSLLPLAVSLVAAPLACRDVHVGGSRNMKIGFLVIFLITIATGIFAIVSSLESVSVGFPPVGSVIGIGILLLAPLAIPAAEKVKEMVGNRYAINRENRVYHFTLEEDHDGEKKVDGVERLESGVNKEGSEEKGSAEAHDDDQVGAMEEIGVKLMMRRINFWLYFLVYFFGATLGFVFLNNLGQIAESRRSSGISSLVSLSSSFGFFGRLIPSVLDHFFSWSKYKLSRPASIVALMAPMAGAFFLLLSPTHLALYISTAIIGVCTGAITSVAVATTTELFGTKNFSINHNVVVANIPVGSFLFGYLAAFLYRKQAGIENGDGKCIGMECYRTTFVIWGSLCLLGTFLAFLLYCRTRKFYSRKL